MSNYNCLGNTIGLRFQMMNMHEPLSGCPPKSGHVPIGYSVLWGHKVGPGTTPGQPRFTCHKPHGHHRRPSSVNHAPSTQRLNSLTAARKLHLFHPLQYPHDALYSG